MQLTLYYETWQVCCVKPWPEDTDERVGVGGSVIAGR